MIVGGKITLLAISLNGFMIFFGISATIFWLMRLVNPRFQYAYLKLLEELVDWIKATSMAMAGKKSEDKIVLERIVN